MLRNTPFILEHIKGIICCPALSRVTSDDIKEGMAEQGVTDVRRITVCRDGVIKPTTCNTYVLTFNSPNLPLVVKIGFMQVKEDVYKPYPLRCYNCQVFGHHENGSVVECLTRDRRAAGSSLTGVTALWSLSKTHLS